MEQKYAIQKYRIVNAAETDSHAASSDENSLNCINKSFFSGKKEGNRFAWRCDLFTAKTSHKSVHKTLNMYGVVFSELVTSRNCRC